MSASGGYRGGKTGWKKNAAEPVKPGAKPPKPFERDHDADAKMFEKLLRDTNDKTVGEFHFKVNHPTCQACEDMIFRFTQKRPGIKIIRH